MYVPAGAANVFVPAAKNVSVGLNLVNTNFFFLPDRQGRISRWRNAFLPLIKTKYQQEKAEIFDEQEYVNVATFSVPS